MGRSAYLPDDTTLDRLLRRATTSVPLAQLPGAPVEHTAASATPGVIDGLARDIARADNLAERFAALAAWLSQLLSARSVFIVDADGLSMTAEPIADGHAAAAGTFSASLDEVARLLPDITRTVTSVELASGEHLSLICCETALGRLTVGASSDSAIPNPLLDGVAPAVRAVADAPI